MSRYTRKHGVEAYNLLMKVLGFPRQSRWNPETRTYSPGLALDWAAEYGGFRIIERQEDERILHPFGEMRYGPREFCAMVNFAIYTLDWRHEHLGHVDVSMWQNAKARATVVGDSSSNDSNDDSRFNFPPDCIDGDCKKCHACYSEYVAAKMAGRLD